MTHSFTISRRDALLWGAACTLGVGSSAWAQGKYPEQTVRLIVALPPGGSVDMIARTLADRLKLSLGQAWIVDNRAGGSGQIGMPLVARAGPDGYTLAVSPASFLTTNKSIFKSLPYDPQADFAPVSRLVDQPMVLVVKDRQKYPTVAALLLRGTEGEPVADARRTPQMDAFRGGRRHRLQDAQEGPLATLPDLPRDITPEATAHYITRVLDGRLPVPAPIAAQVAHILQERRQHNNTETNGPPAVTTP